MIYFRNANSESPIVAVAVVEGRCVIEELTDERALQIASDLLVWLAARRGKIMASHAAGSSLV